MYIASGTIPYAASFLVSALNGFETCPINHQSQVDVMIRQTNQIEGSKHWFHLTRQVRGVVRAHSEAQQSPNVTEYGISNISVKLPRYWLAWRPAFLHKYWPTSTTLHRLSGDSCAELPSIRV